MDTGLWIMVAVIALAILGGLLGHGGSSSSDRNCQEYGRYAIEVCD